MNEAKSLECAGKPEKRERRRVSYEPTGIQLLPAITSEAKAGAALRFAPALHIQNP